MEAQSLSRINAVLVEGTRPLKLYRTNMVSPLIASNHGGVHDLSQRNVSLLLMTMAAQKDAVTSRK